MKHTMIPKSHPISSLVIVSFAIAMAFGAGPALAEEEKKPGGRVRI